MNFLWRKDWKVFKFAGCEKKQKKTRRWVADGKELKMKKC
ncbi:hypothetical protein D932_01804 [Enterococcus casseliflavus 14-MB-W-14]|nr:hypothetical protein D932_01804 [Enterococcus casseliflavus 14-MB-W-14]